MKLKHLLRRTGVCLIMSAAMLISSIAGSGDVKPLYAAESPQTAADGTRAQKLYDSMMKSNSSMPVPEKYKKDYEPYGYGLDVPFFLNRQDELVLWDSNDKTGSDQLRFEIYDGLKEGNTGSLFSNAKE